MNSILSQFNPRPRPLTFIVVLTSHLCCCVRCCLWVCEVFVSLWGFCESVRCCLSVCEVLFVSLQAANTDKRATLIYRMFYVNQWRILIRKSGLAEGYAMPSARPDPRIRIRHWSECDHFSTDQIFQSICRTQRFIIVTTKSRHQSPSWASSIHFTSSQCYQLPAVTGAFIVC
jgi:hypothetical protein